MGEVVLMSVHVFPVNDLWEHETEGECWCDTDTWWVDPETGQAYPEPLVIHNAADGRELMK